MRTVTLLIFLYMSVFAEGQHTSIVRPKRLPAFDTILYAYNFSVSGASADNSPFIRNLWTAVAAVPANLKVGVFFPANQDTLRCKSKINNMPNRANLYIDFGAASGTYIKNEIPVNPAVYTQTEKPNQQFGDWLLLSQSTVANIIANVPVLDPIPALASTVRISTANAASLVPGDMVNIESPKFGVTTARSTLSLKYKVIQSVNYGTGVLTFNIPFVNDETIVADSLTLTAFKPNQNTVVKNLKLFCYRGGLGSGISLLNLSNSIVENCFIDGAAIVRGTEVGYSKSTTDAFVGLIAKGENVTIRNTEVVNFWDYDQNLGYGILAAGNNVVIENCTVRRAKHGITISDGGIVGPILAQYNLHDDAMFDTHPEGRFVKVQHCTFINVGRSTTGVGLYNRGLWQTTRHCTFTVTPSFDRTSITATNTLGISIQDIEIAGSRAFKIDSCEITGMAYAISDVDQSVTKTDFFIRGNKTFACGQYGGIYLRNSSNATISGNEIESAGQAIYVIGASNMAITGNTVNRYGKNHFGGGIYLGSTGITSSNITITGNTVKYFAPEAGGNATNPIRVQGTYSYAYVQNNTIQNWGSASNSIRYDENPGCMVISGNTGSTASVNTCGN